MANKNKNLIISYLEWAKEQPPNHYEIETDDCKIVIDGIEMNIPTEQDLVASFEEEAAKRQMQFDQLLNLGLEE